MWLLWLQGTEAAPPIVQACVESWRHHNPGWEIVVLDASNLRSYLPTRRLVDLVETSAVTPASLSDLVRFELLHEYGGVWVDATTFCTRPLDAWLPPCVDEGFFAFERPDVDRHVSTWFLASAGGHPLITEWYRRALEYWEGRSAADEYFWAHYCFTEMLLENADCRERWAHVPRRSADEPQQARRAGLHARVDRSDHPIWSPTPVHKLTHRFPMPTRPVTGTTLLGHVLQMSPTSSPSVTMTEGRSGAGPFRAAPARPVRGFSLTTSNVGDHVQAIALERLLDLHGVEIVGRVDRDAELDSVTEPCTIFLAGWFKHGDGNWPPAAVVDAVYLSFHMRPHQSAALLSDEAIEHYRRHEPVYGRDQFTVDRLRAEGVRSEVSNCAATTFPRRLISPDAGKVFVVSRDRRILEHLPPDIGEYEYVTQYAPTSDHDANMAIAGGLLDRYRTEARLVITSLLHCALPSIAMGIPTVVVWPINSRAGQASDRERFSTLSSLVPIHTMEQLRQGEARVVTPDIASTKLGLRRLVADSLSDRGASRPFPVELLADPTSLPPGSSHHSDERRALEAELRRRLDGEVRASHPSVSRVGPDRRSWWGRISRRIRPFR